MAIGTKRTERSIAARTAAVAVEDIPTTGSGDAAVPT
jgi:hypothetical protein